MSAGLWDLCVFPSVKDDRRIQSQACLTVDRSSAGEILSGLLMTGRLVPGGALQERGRSPSLADQGGQPEGGVVDRDSRSGIECSRSGGTSHQHPR